MPIAHGQSEPAPDRHLSPLPKAHNSEDDLERALQGIAAAGPAGEHTSGMEAPAEGISFRHRDRRKPNVYADLDTVEQYVR
jgi:hypothetical protein